MAPIESQLNGPSRGHLYFYHGIRPLFVQVKPISGPDRFVCSLEGSQLEKVNGVPECNAVDL